MRNRFAIPALLVIALTASLVSWGLVAPSVLAQQTPQVVNIGVLGASDGPTAQGVLLAIQRINANGPVTGPGNVTYSLNVIANDVKSSEDVTNTLAQFKQNNVVAIFGPEDEKLAQSSSAALAAAGVPVFESATGNIQTGAMVFRTRANDSYQMNSLADFMTTDLNKAKVSIFQGSDTVSGAVGNLVQALTKLNHPPAPPVIQVENGAVADSAKVLLSATPDAVVAFGAPAQVADLYLALRASNFSGTFITPAVDDRTFIEAIPASLRSGLYGITTWPYSWDDSDTASFTHDYVAVFGTVPTPISAASYDAAIALIIGIKNAGTTPTAVQTALMGLSAAKSLQGTFNPKLGNGELAADSFIIVTGPYGAPSILAHYNEAGRIKLVTVLPTNTPLPASVTPVPSATPEGVVGTVKSTANVRTGPGTVYAVIGQLKKGDQIQLTGASADFQWFTFDFRAQQGWVNGPLLDIFGNTQTLPVVQAPPTPIPTNTPPATTTPTSVPFADLALVSATLNPTVPQPGVPFTLSVTVKNQGLADAGQFAVATSFDPGGVYAAQVVGGLAAGQQTTVNLGATVNGTGNFSIAIVLDLNNQVNEGPNGKDNNKPQFAYKIDRNKPQQGTANIPQNNTANFDGGNPDISWDGTKIVPVNGAKLGVLNGTQMTQIYWDFLSPDKINNTTGIARSDLVPGLVVGMYTAEGKRGAFRVAGYNGDTIILEFFVYDA